MTFAVENTANRVWNILRVVGWAVVPVILLTPLIAMQSTREVNWTTTDFVFAGVLLIGAGLAIELLTRPFRKPLPRFAVAAAVGLAAMLVWVEAAVGIFR